MTLPKSTADYDIRLLTADESSRLRISHYAFAASPQAPPSDEELQRSAHFVQNARFPHAFDAQGKPAARLAVYPQTMNVRSKVLPAGGIGSVASLPTARRGGMVRAVMLRSFELMREDGQVVSGLYPFRESFYQRLGYAGWTAPRWTSINPTHLAPLLRMESGGDVEWGLIGDLWESWNEVLEGFQALAHGMALSDEPRREIPRDKNAHWVVIVRENGRIAGGMAYRITAYGESMIVHNFFPFTTAAIYNLLGWIARHTDQVKEARIQLPASIRPELLLPDLQAPVISTDTEAWVAPMGRVVSVDGLSGIGAGDGAVTLEITDEACPWNTGIWTLQGDGGILDASRGGTPDASITIQALSALVFTGSEPETFAYRGWGHVDTRTAATLRRLFPPATPYLHDLF